MTKTKRKATTIYLQDDIATELEAFTRELRVASGGDDISKSEAARRALLEGMKVIRKKLAKP